MELNGGDRKPHASVLSREKAESLRQEIMAFFREHPFSTQKECALALGVNQNTINRHVAILKERMKEDIRA